MEYILFSLNYLSFEEKFTMINQEKHEIEQIYTWDPITTALIMFNIDSIISIVFLSLTADVLPCEMSLLARSKERWLFSQARTYSSKNWTRYKIHEVWLIV